MIRMLLCTLALSACALQIDATASEDMVFMITAASAPPPYPDDLPMLQETPLPITAICADGWYSYNLR